MVPREVVVLANKYLPDDDAAIRHMNYHLYVSISEWNEEEVASKTWWSGIRVLIGTASGAEEIKNRAMKNAIMCAFHSKKDLVKILVASGECCHLWDSG